jgi:hypothetical protein
MQYFLPEMDSGGAKCAVIEIVIEILMSLRAGMGPLIYK